MTKEAVRPLALRSREAAKALGISERTLARLKAGGELPFVRVGAVILFAVNDLQSWLAGRREVEGGAIPSNAV